MERCPSWPKEHDWKSCMPQKGIWGSNPHLSATFRVLILKIYFTLKIWAFGFRGIARAQTVLARFARCGTARGQNPRKPSHMRRQLKELFLELKPYINQRMWRRDGDLNPSYPVRGKTVFETAAFDHSAIPPKSQEGILTF